MTIQIAKSNQYGLLTPGAIQIRKTNLYAILQPAIQITKTNIYGVYIENTAPEETPIKIGQVFPFSLGNTIWAVPFYVKPKG